MDFSEKYQSKWNAPNDEKAEHIWIAKQCRLGIVEIGVLNGSTSKLLAEANPDIPVYGIDPIVPDSMAPSEVGDTGRIQANTGELENYHFVQEYSYEVVKKWSLPFDYIFIDGDHRYEEVRRDFLDWLPLLTHRGFLSLHDSAANRGGPHFWPGPSQLADGIIRKGILEYIKTVYALTIFRKRA